MQSDGTPVHFVYLDKEEIGDREFEALCHFVPRVGDAVHPKPGFDDIVIVRSVSHRFIKLDPTDEHFQQVVTVMLSDQRPDEVEKRRAEFLGD